MEKNYFFHFLLVFSAILKFEVERKRLTKDDDDNNDVSTTKLCYDLSTPLLNYNNGSF